MMDISGLTFNRWTVLRFDRIERGKTLFLCRCACGTKRPVRSDQLVRGISKSCGCLKREIAAAQIRRLFTIHGMSNKTRTYGIWKGIRKRCLNPKDKRFCDYGGRGISICKRWDNYQNFLDDMGEAPKNHSIDRIDVNKGYSPENCRWATKTTQARNTRNSLVFSIRGKTKHLKEWCEITGINYHTAYQRIFRLGWSPEDALG